MLRQINSCKVCSCVKSSTYHAAEADEAVEHSLHIGRVLGDKTSSAKKLKHIPEVGEDYGKGCLYKFRCVAVKHTPYTPDKKQKSADPPGNLMTFAQRLYSVKFFHIVNPFDCILNYYNILLTLLPQIEKIFFLLYMGDCNKGEISTDSQ